MREKEREKERQIKTKTKRSDKEIKTEQKDSEQKEIKKTYFLLRYTNLKSHLEAKKNKINKRK